MSSCHPPTPTSPKDLPFFRTCPLRWCNQTSAVSQEVFAVSYWKPGLFGSFPTQDADSSSPGWHGIRLDPNLNWLTGVGWNDHEILIAFKGGNDPQTTNLDAILKKRGSFPLPFTTSTSVQDVTSTTKMGTVAEKGTSSSNQNKHQGQTIPIPDIEFALGIQRQLPRLCQNQSLWFCCFSTWGCLKVQKTLEFPSKKRGNYEQEHSSILRIQAHSDVLCI